MFAIVILSAIGSMFANGHHSMMGSDEDPEDGGKVAMAVFGAVAVYGVSIKTGYDQDKSSCCAGLPSLLCMPSLYAQATKPARRDRATIERPVFLRCMSVSSGEV